MCLITRMRYAKVATKDIEVYKRVKVIPIAKQAGIIKTSFRCVEIPTIPCRFVAEGLETINKSDCSDFYCVSERFIHAYKNMRLAIKNCFPLNVVIKAIIPAGTPYFEGEDEICAKEMYLQGAILDDNYFSVEIFEYLDPSIPIFKFDANTATFKQINLPVREPIKELEEVCV